MGVIPVPPAISPIASCLQTSINPHLLWIDVLVLLPLIFRNRTTDSEELSSGHVVQVRAHRSIRVLFDQQIECALPPRWSTSAPSA
jgi:hypothetical protein